MRKKCLVLVSGGMDSVCALYYAHRDFEVVGGVSFDYGAKHNHKEIPFAAEHCANLGVPHFIIPLDFMGRLFRSDLLRNGGDVPDGHYQEQTMKQTVVPFRNGIMLAVAGGLAESMEAQAVVIAAHAGDHAIYPDCREEFMTAMGEAIRLGTYAEVEILRPFISFHKSDIVRRGVDLGVNFAKTWSCYKGRAVHCGACGTCVERREAFQLCGIVDPTEYGTTGPLPRPPGNPNREI